MSEEETPQEEIINNVVWDYEERRQEREKDLSNNVFFSAFEFVESLVTGDGDIVPVYPFVPGGINHEEAFEVLLYKINESFSDDPDESVANITSVTFLAFMMGAWVASTQDNPGGYNIQLTKEQISQVVQNWVSLSLEQGE